jgi:5-methylcytosine-specific restriction protein B
MINVEKLKVVLVSYKQDFLPRQWNMEKYKWEIVKHFQDHWNIHASDFLNMFVEATNKTANLLASLNIVLFSSFIFTFHSISF